MYKRNTKVIHWEIAPSANNPSYSNHITLYRFLSKTMSGSKSSMYWILFKDFIFYNYSDLAVELRVKMTPYKNKSDLAYNTYLLLLQLLLPST